MRRRWRSTPITFLVLSIAASAVATAALAAASLGPFDFEPPFPDTWDRVAVAAQVTLPEDCLWEATAFALYGEQPDIPGGPAWGIDLLLEPTLDPCIPGTFVLEVAPQLEGLPVASAAGILRLWVGGQQEDAAPFTLGVAAGAVPGAAAPAAHHLQTLFVQSAALTQAGDFVAIADRLNHVIHLTDPEREIIVSSLQVPGTGDVRGLAWDGAALYASLADPITPRIYRLGLTGQVLDAFASPVIAPGKQPLEGLAWRDGVLYGAYPSPPRLFAINPITHAVIWSRALAVRLTGLDALPDALLGVEPSGIFHRLAPTVAGGDVLIADRADAGLPGDVDLTGLSTDGRQVRVFDQQHALLRTLRTHGVWWTPDGALAVGRPPDGGPVDLIRGRLEAVTQSAAYVDLGPTDCLLADATTGHVVDTEVPALGGGFFYLARFRAAGGSDTSWGRSSAGFRRLETAPACP